MNKYSRKKRQNYVYLKCFVTVQSAAASPGSNACILHGQTGLSSIPPASFRVIRAICCRVAVFGPGRAATSTPISPSAAKSFSGTSASSPCTMIRSNGPICGEIARPSPKAIAALAIASCARRSSASIARLWNRSIESTSRESQIRFRFPVCGGAATAPVPQSSAL
jgi:hypothetical protein